MAWSDDQQPIVADTWADKYRYGDEPDLDATYRRVIEALTQGESEAFRARALAAAERRLIMPGGRILAGAGTTKRVTWINCFVLDVIQDSMQTSPEQPGSGIMDSCSRAAFTLQMGGGIGQDFSTIRPRGARVQRTGSVSSGVIPFMNMWHSMADTIMSAGHRRGAMMANLRVDHPDIEEFITAKQRPGALTNFNVSVLVTDAFMRAVKDDLQWPLHFPVPRADGTSSEHTGLAGHLAVGRIQVRVGGSTTYVYRWVRARELWDRILQSTYVHAEPGVIFIDRVNRLNNLSYCETISATNPCGEQPLPPNGDCCLGHVNLAEMVVDPFTPDAHFDYDALTEASQVMVRLLDDVLDTSPFPLEAQYAEAQAKRRIGLGFTGLASALQQLCVPYGTGDALSVVGNITRAMALAAYEESCELAAERGSFPAFSAGEYLAAPFIERLPESVRSRIASGGIRNSVLLSIAPTGTTSLVLGNVSSGIEPVFAHRYRRVVRGGDGELSREYSVHDYGYLRYCHMYGLDPDADHDLPKYFVTADQLTVSQHLQTVAAAQEWIDAAITKTINCPTSMSVDEFKLVYDEAYRLGLKGCTTYRPDTRSSRGAVMTTGKPDAGVPEQSTSAVRPASKVPMQEVADARRYRVSWPGEDCAYYVIITDYTDDQGRRRPFEIFISTKSARHDDWIKALTLMITAIFRRAEDPVFILDELRQVYSAKGGAWMGGHYVPSLVSAIAMRIEEHFRWLGMVGGGEQPAPGSAPLAAELLDICERCGMRAVIYLEGCATCRSCGHSDCS